MPGIARRRLAAQLLIAPADAPEQVVARLGAVQAQDYLGALWAIGVRTTAARVAEVERAIADRRFVRTWPMRGTLHFVAPQDARWMTGLLAPKMVERAGKRILGRRISAHSMRHSFATLAIREGASIKAVSKYLGHSSTAITMDMYVHERLEKGQKVRRPFG